MKIKTTLSTISAIIALAMMAMSIFSQNSNFSLPQNMGATLNMASNDINAVLSPNGLSLYFSSNRTGSLGLNDIYVSQRATLNSAWGAPQNLGATVNSSSTEAMGSLSLDGKTMFFQSNRVGGFGGRDNYLSTRTDPNNNFGWTTPVNLGSVANSSLDELAATYFEDPTTSVNSIIFSSNRVTNPTIYHLYQSTRNADGTFNAPIAIPELEVGAEVRAAIRRDGLEVFISATLPPAMPGDPPNIDIWVATRASTTSTWSTPMLVAGINSLADDGSPSLSPDGSILYFNSTRDGSATDANLYSVTRCSLYAANVPCGINRSATTDFDGDGRTDLSVFRPSDGTWWVMQSGSNTVSIRQFGALGDKTVPGDYDGDGRTDLAVFRPSNASWWISNSSDSSVSVVNWGVPTDKPVAGDYDGDGKTDIAVYRNGTWYIRQSSNLQLSTQQFGLSSDIPIAAANVQ